MSLSYTIELNDKKEAEELQRIARDRGWNLKPKIVTAYRPATNEKEKIDALQQIFKRGNNISNYGDAAEWQRNTREDTKLPYRD